MADGAIQWQGKPLTGLNSTFLGKLEAALRAIGATAVNVTSARRDPADGIGVPNSNHNTGNAIDGSALVNGQWIPIGTAVKPVASLFGLRSGDVPGFYLGKPDLIHVDDGTNVGGVTPTGGTGRTGAAIVETFFRGVLALLGAPATQDNLDFLGSWSTHEVTAAKNNPLATTQPASGSYPLEGNTAGVQQYPSLSTGVRATALTLQNGHYPTILAGLKSGNPYAVQAIRPLEFAKELSTWSGSGYTKVERPDGNSGSLLDRVAGAITGGAGAAIDASPLGPFIDAGGTAVDTAQAVGEFLGKLTDPNYILRGLQIVAGGLMVGGGVFLLAKQVGLAVAFKGVPIPGAEKRTLNKAYAEGERQAAIGNARKAGRQGGSLGGGETPESVRRGKIQAEAEAIDGEVPY